MTTEYILLYTGLVTCGFTFIFLMSWVLKLDDRAKHLVKWPKVVVLVAARDEEANIARCLDALLAMDYPKHKLEIWVGNDASSDRTLEMIKEYAEREHQIKYLDIIEQVGNAKGKANVLAQLAAASDSKHILITDADIAVCKEWAKSMVAEVEKNDQVGIVMGTTVVEKGGFLSELQCIDLIFAIGQLKSLYDFGIPVSALGNNTLVTRKAYESTGGYEKIPFSITEDHELFKAIRKKKWKARCLYHTDVLGLSKPAGSLGTLLHQRKRWMKGAMELKPLPWTILILYGFFYPIMIALTILNPTLGIGLLLVKFFIQGIFTLYLMDRLKLTKYAFSLPIYELYSLLLTTSTMLFFVIPKRTVWKGRKY